MSNALGVPETIEGWWQLARSVRARRAGTIDSLARQEAWEYRVSTQVGRWPRSPLGTEPGTYTPADILKLRTLAAGLDLGLGLADASGAPAYRGSLAELVLTGVPFWLPGGTARGITHSEPPVAEMMVDLRLPHDVQVVWFGAPAHLGTASGLVADIVRASVIDAMGPAGMRLDDVPWELAVGAAALVCAHPDDPAPSEVQVSIVGVVLTADEDGRPSDLIGWAYEALPPPTEVRNRPVRGVLIGRRSEAALAAVVDNLMAVVAWGDWTIPTGPPPPLRGADRREIRKWLRRNNPSTLVPVRVLVAPRPGTARHQGPPIGTHASPVTHLRRGHWRRQFFRSTGSHRPAWIAPTVVNPGWTDDTQVVVWRLPEAHGAQL